MSNRPPGNATTDSAAKPALLDQLVAALGDTAAIRVFAAEIESRAATARPEPGVIAEPSQARLSALRRSVQEARVLLDEPHVAVLWEVCNMLSTTPDARGPHVSIHGVRARLDALDGWLREQREASACFPSKAGRPVDRRFDEALKVVLMVWLRTGGRFATGQNSRFVRAAEIAVPVVAGVPSVHGVRAIVRRLSAEWDERVGGRCIPTAPP